MPQRYHVDPRDGLTARQRLAVDLLAKGHTIRHVARELGVTERTITRYRSMPTVMKAVYRVQQEFLQSTDARGVSHAPEAVETLKAIVSNPDARDSDRIAASRALLNGAQAYAERRILERQIRDLENLLRTMTDVALPNRSDYEHDDDDEPLDFEGLDPLLPSAAVTPEWQD